MGQTKSMALSLFNPTFFPAYGHRAASPLARLDDMFGGAARFDGMFAEADARRRAFLSEMDVDNNEAPSSQCYSFSSSSYQTSGEAPVTQCKEEYSTSDGDVVSRVHKSIGDKTVEETIKGGETKRTLTNVAEEDLAQFEQAISQHRHRLPQRQMPGKLALADTLAPSLPAALSDDIARLQKHQ